MDLGLKGAKVLVTGSTRGIGRAIAETFAAEGANVGICSRNQADVDSAVAALKADPAVKGVLIPGSISVVQQLLAAGLIDELHLLVHPVAARKGRRLFDDGDAPYHLKVAATEAFPTGVIRVIYSPTEAPTKVGYDEIKDRVPEGK